MAKTTAPITAKKSYSAGQVSISVKLSGHGHYCDRVKIEGSTNITSEEARKLGLELMRLADETDAKVAAKAAHEERRKKWREREIAAGRMQVFRRL